MSDSHNPLLMIPGPIEVSPAVLEAFNGAPPSHLAGEFIERFGRSIEMMREVWGASADSQPFVLAGSGTIAMEMAACNVLEPGDTALVVNTGYFSDRMAEMLDRRGAKIVEVGAQPGDSPTLEDVEAALEDHDVDALFATHVDTSTGVRVDAEGLARLADERGVLSIFDGVCATAGESFAMADWGADVYLTASQKAVGVPPGLALMVASPRALQARRELSTPPPMSIDWQEWLPIMNAYENREGSYFSTPATNLVEALYASLQEITEFQYDGKTGIAARTALHADVADAMRAGWEALGLELMPVSLDITADTLSAILYPDGVGSELTDAIAERGIAVAGGLYPGRKADYFRVGHMGHVVTQPEQLLRTVRAVGEGLEACGYAADVEAAVAATHRRLER